MPDLLPPNATKQERDISLALDRLPEVPIKTLWTPQTCPEAHLPWLAWALSVDEWDAAWPAEMKRQAVAGSIEQHRKKGTVGALRRALQQLGYEVEIDERTGTAYTFKLRFKVREGESAGGAVVESAIAKATQVALRQKNARSELLGTDLIAETDPVKMYVGGASVSGAEVDIGVTNATALPLDDWPDYLLGSYWTVRMHSSYTGPIARVRRISDGAELNYMSIGELAAFVNGESGWDYIKFFNQRGAAGVAVVTGLVSGAYGVFDANGIPCLSPITAGPRFAVPITSQRLSEMTSIVYGGGPVATSKSFEFNRTAGHQIALQFNNPSSAKARLVTPSGYAEIDVDVGGSSHVSPYIIRLNPTDIMINDSVYFDTNTANFNPVTIKTLNLFDGNTPGIENYGIAIWQRDLGEDESEAIQAAVTAKFTP